MVGFIRSSIAGFQAVPARIAAIAATAMTLAIVACGGGGYSANNANSNVPNPGPADVSVGTVTGFGSVHLNGLKFETTSATITVDGRAATQDDLHAGDVIEVRGHHDTTSGKDVADEIEFRGNIEGPVSAIDAQAQTLVVLGQTVAVSADTSFDDDISPASLAGIKVSDIVEVSGMPAADGTIRATRIEAKAAGATLQVIGTAALVNAGAKSLKINDLLVDYSAATLVDFPNDGPKDGDLVEATGTTVTAGGALTATRLELRTGKGLKADAGSHSEVEGLITRFASPSDFDVAGRAVTTSSSTAFEGGSASDLALDVRVEAEGPVDSSATLAAAKVRIGKPAPTRILAQVDSVDAAAGTAIVLGIQITVDPMTRFEDHGSQKVATFSLADVHSGDWLEIQARSSTGGSDTLLATRVDRRQAQSAVRLTGAVTTAQQPSFTIVSVSVTTTNATQFNHGLSSTTFFNGLVGTITSVRGSWDGNTLTATEAQLGDGGDEMD